MNQGHSYDSILCSLLDLGDLLYEEIFIWCDIRNNSTRPLSRCYLRSCLVKKRCMSSQRAQQEIQEPSSNTEEQEL